jgi:hypothetical protein
MVWFAKAQRFPADLLAAMVAQATGGELHIALAPEPRWLDDQERAAANRDLARETAAYSGVHSSNKHSEDEPDFQAVAELLSKPPSARYGWVSDGQAETPLGVLVAGNHWFGAIAVREDDSIWVRTFWPESLSEVLADVLPDDSWKSSAQPITVMRGEMLTADDDAMGFVPPRAEVRRAQRVVGLEAHGIAEFYAQVTEGGKQRRSKYPLRVYDTEDGRWTMRVTPVHSDERIDLAPAGHEDVTRILDGLSRELHQT